MSSTRDAIGMIDTPAEMEIAPVPPTRRRSGRSQPVTLITVANIVHTDTEAGIALPSLKNASRVGEKDILPDQRSAQRRGTTAGDMTTATPDAVIEETDDVTPPSES